MDTKQLSQIAVLVVGAMYVAGVVLRSRSRFRATLGEIVAVTLALIVCAIVLPIVFGAA